MDKELETGVTQTQGIYDPNYSCTSIAISGHLGGLKLNCKYRNSSCEPPSRVSQYRSVHTTVLSRRNGRTTLKKCL